MAEIKPLACYCNEKNPLVSSDDEINVTFIECGSCGRCIGGLTMNEAVRMWNAAMDILKISRWKRAATAYPDRKGFPTDGVKN